MTTKNTKKNAAKSWERKASTPLEITEVKINWVNDKQGVVLAMGKVTLNGCLDISISLMQGKNGAFVSMPSHKVKDKYYSDVFCADTEIMQEINDAVLSAYEDYED